MWPVLADLLCVLVFAMAGKSSHEAGASEWVVLAIAWPYALSAALAGVVLVLARRQAERLWPEGVLVLGVTYVLGTLLRVLSGRGIAGGFLVVSALFLALTLLGWRAIVSQVKRRRNRA